MIQIQSRVERYKLSLPQSIREIPANYFADVVNCINLPEHYAIIAIVRQIKLMEFVMTLSNPKSKVHASDSAVLCAYNSKNIPDTWSIGQQVIISESNVQMGNQIVIPSALSYENVAGYFANEEAAVRAKNPNDKETLIKKILTGEAKDEKGTPIKEYPICFLSFKVVPVTAIKGTVDSKISYNDPFVEVIKDVPTTKEAAGEAAEQKENE